MRYNGSTWEAVGSAGFTDGAASNMRIAIDSGGTPYVHFKNSLGLATVMKYDGNAWQLVGPAGFSDGIIYDSDIEIDGNDTPHVVYVDSSHSYRLVAKKWDGATWTTVGSAGFSSLNASHPRIAFDSDATPYVIYSDSNVVVERFNGSSWAVVGNTGFAEGFVQGVDIVIDGNDVPHAVYLEDSSSEVGEYKATLKTYDGDWETVGSERFSPRSGGMVDVALDSNGKPYVAYTEDSTAQAMVSEYDTANDTWEVIGDSAASAGPSNHVALALGSGDLPHVVFMDGANGNRATVQRAVMQYAVTYDGNGNDGGSVPADALYEDGEGVTVSGNDGELSRAGHTFAGWNTAADGSGTAYAGGDAFTMGAADVTLYAQWAANDYTVSYSGNGHDGGSAPAGSTHTYNSTVTVAGSGTLTRTGYTFAGWNTAADGSGASYAAGDTFKMGASNVTLYAQWAVNDYTVSYDGNGNDGGSAPAGGDHAYNSTVTVASSGTLSRTGYTFAGWNTVPDGSGAAYSAGGTFAMGASDVTLYAQWEINHYMVSYSGNGHDEGSPPVGDSYPYNSTVTVAGSGSLARKGYTFAGWNTAPDSSGTPYSAGDIFAMGTADVSLYAQWVINEYDISVTASPAEGGEAGCEPDSVEHGGSSTCSATASEGYTFTGWSGDCAGSECALENVTGPQAVTANFELNSYTVSPSAGEGGGISPAAAQTVDHGDSVDFALTPDTGYSVDSIAGSCPGSLSDDVYTAGPIEDDCSVEATFSPNSVDGSCGQADGDVVTEAPSENLCEAGNASDVTGDGPWFWSCQGTDGGTDAECSAELEHYAVATSVIPSEAGTLTCDPDPVGYGRSSVCTADASENFTFEGFDGDCDAIDGQTCTLASVTSARSVEAGFLSTMAGESPNDDHPGELQAVASGGAPGQWVFDHAESQGYIAPEEAGSAPPGYLEFPFGLLGFVLVDGEPGRPATVVISYPEPLPADADYWKYDSGSDEWYPLPPEHYEISGNTVTLELTDGGAGDLDGMVDGRIVDPGGLATIGAAGEPLPVPVLPRPLLLVLAALVFFLGGFRVARGMWQDPGLSSEEKPG